MLRTVLTCHRFLVSLHFDDQLSLHLVTFLMFLVLFMPFFLQQVHSWAEVAHCF